MLKLANDNHVVMVDDNVGDLFFLEHCFRASGLTHPWLAFKNGPAFLAHLGRVKSGHEPMPALVLLDLNMPGMNGLEVLKETRKDPIFASLPIVCILTSSTDPRDKQQAAELGASGFRLKPTDVDECVAFFDSLKP